MYQALYRKYRPKDFDSVVGQDVVVKTLTNSIVNNNFSHAYMFFGPRGTGKTTVSKIFARNINCLNPTNGIACGKCSACEISFSRDCIDIIEIDAASNNGVDEIRELKNKITLVPSQLKYKVYIIDEVHMLSIGAFNALLKTLEEPPNHAIFILATTDPQKVPETIVSRCQCFSFNRISPEIISKKLSTICSLENIKIDNDVLLNISIIADGGMRDALVMLDKISSYSNKKITMDEFAEINSIIVEKDLHKLLDCILTGDASVLLNLLNEFDSNGKNLIQIVIQLLNYTRNLIVNYYINKISAEYSIDLLLKFANYINENLFDIKKSGNVRVSVEILLLKFIGDNISLVNNLNKSIEKKSENTVEIEKKITKSSKNTTQNVDKPKLDEASSTNFINKNSSDNSKIINLDDIIRVRINNTLAEADKKLLNEELNLFEKLKEYTFDENIGYIVCSLLDGKVRAVSSKNLIISFEYASNVEQNLSIFEKLSTVYNNITNSNKQIAIVSDSEWNDIKNKYIMDLKNNIKYEIQKEPEVIFEELNKDDIISNNAIELFGDIVEVE